MTDPVQVVAEALCRVAHQEHRRYANGECRITNNTHRVDAARAVAALTAAGALMPEEAQALRDQVGLYTTDRWIERDNELETARALLQDLREVLAEMVVCADACRVVLDCTNYQQYRTTWE